MLFDIESFDYGQYDTGTEGLKLTLVHHLDMPLMGHSGINLGSGTDNQIGLAPTLMATSQNALENFSPSERDCYAENEISLKYLPRSHEFRYNINHVSS